MWCELNEQELIELVNKQLGAFWIRGGKILEEAFPCVTQALKRLEISYTKIQGAYFRKDGEVVFHVEHTVQYAIFLYMLSNQLYKAGYSLEAGYVYYLNKIMHSVEWFYEVDLPDYFCAQHPLASILGRAVYGNYLFVYQGVTVGGNRKGDKIIYPQLGENVLLYSDSKILGDTRIGNNVVVSANSYLINEKIPDNSIVFGSSPNIVVKSRTREEILEMTNHIWKLD